MLTADLVFAAFILAAIISWIFANTEEEKEMVAEIVLTMLIVMLATVVGLAIGLGWK